MKYLVKFKLSLYFVFGNCDLAKFFNNKNAQLYYTDTTDSHLMATLLPLNKARGKKRRPMGVMNLRHLTQKVSKLNHDRTIAFFLKKYN